MVPPMSQEDQPDQAPSDGESAALPLERQPAEAPHGAMQTLADVAMAPVAEVLHGHAWWLRAAMLLQFLATGAVGFIGFRQGLGEWQAYLGLGACVTILIGNFMRWREISGFLRRLAGTLLALAVDFAWAVLLWDRARTPAWEDAFGRPVPAPGWFWAPLGMVVLSGALLIAHLLSAPRRKVAD